MKMSFFIQLFVLWVFLVFLWLKGLDFIYKSFRLLLAKRGKSGTPRIRKTRGFIRPI